MNVTILAWAATALSLFGTCWIAAKLPRFGWAYPVLLFGSAVWAALAIVHHDKAQMVMWGVYSVINCIGAARWTLGTTEVNPLQSAVDDQRKEIVWLKELNDIWRNDMHVERRRRLDIQAELAALKGEKKG